MKKLILFIFLAAGILIFQSCLTVGRIERNCDKFTKVCVANTVTKTVNRDTTIFRTDTVFVQLPADTVTITDTVHIKSGSAFLPWKHYRKGIISVDAAVQWSVLKISAYLNDSTILVPEKDTIVIPNAIRISDKTQTVTVVKKYIPGFYKFTFWWFVASVLLTGIIISKTFF